MTVRIAPVIAWVSLVVFVVVWALAAAFAPVLDCGAACPQGDVRLTYASLAIIPAFACVGALIVSRLPRNPIGWLLCAGALSLPLSAFASEYAITAHALVADSWPAGRLFAWLGLWVGSSGVSLLWFVFLLFPDGRLPSPRWRPLWWLAVFTVVLVAVMAALGPGTYARFGHPEIANPLQLLTGDTLAVLTVLSSLVPVPLTAAAVLAVVARWRRVRGDARLQLKWLVYAAGMFLVAIVLSGANAAQHVLPEFVVAAVVMPAFLAIPTAIGIGILRYHLYDIDLLINRTVVYGATSAAIAVMFFGGIVVLQTLFRPLTSGSELAVAASTLASFALFQPIRRRVQEAVDRRFYRSRYDAARILDSFAVRLRDEVDLEAVRADLLGSVHQTMAPAHVSLWLRIRP